MDHPALLPSSAALALLDPRSPRQDQNGLVRIPRFPHGPDASGFDPDSPGWLFLGTFHPTCAPPSPDLSEYLEQTQKDRRAWYHNALLEAQADARQSDGLTLQRLVLEHQLWLRFDDQMLVERVWRHIERWPEENGGHWLWTGRFDGDRPWLSWRGQDNVPVFHLLWAREKPTVLIGSRRPRKVDTCPEAEPFRRCVNPHHFSLPFRLDRARRIRVKVGQSTGRVTGTVKWSVAHVDASDRVLCPRCEQPMGEIYQQRYKLGALRGTGWCGFCAEIERQLSDRAAKWPRVTGYLGMSPAEERSMWNDIARDHPFGGGPQVVPPDPEPIRYVQPAYEEPDQNDI